MKNRLRWMLWGILGAIVVVAAIVVLVLWADRPGAFPSDATHVPRDVGSLEEALASASPGDTIVIQESENRIHGAIVVETPDITLVSSGSRASVSGSGANPAISVLAEGVVLRGFDITSESIGLRVDASDCTIEDIHVSSTPIGIQLTNASRCVVRSIETHGGRIGVELIDSGSAGVESSSIAGASEYGVRLLNSWNNELKNLNLSDNAVAISVEQASVDNIIEACHIQRCSIAGIEIRSSNDNTIADCAVETSRIGILLEGVTGIEIRSCTIESSIVSGLLLQQSLQNRVTETRIDGSQGTGIQLSQSGENALRANAISDCLDTGISLVSSGRNLIMGNDVDACLTGVAISRSSDTRVLRNTISNSELAGILLSQASSNRLLDNTSMDGGYGVVVVESTDCAILRNGLTGSSDAGMLMINTSGGSHVADNVIRDNARGLVLASARRDFFTQNEILSNEIGVWLTNLGSGIRIEGNTIAGNETGLRQSSSLAETEHHLAALGVVFAQDTEHIAPVLANNVFAGNSHLDIYNDTLVPLPAADNWWGNTNSRDSTEAAVSDGVLLEQSAWKGVIAVGTGSDDVRVLLGRILQFSLVEAGFRVIDLVGIGPSERVQQALADSDVDLIWWSGTTADSQSLVATPGLAVVPSSAVEGWQMIVSSQLADQLAEPTASSLSDWTHETGDQLRFAAMDSFDREGFDAFLSAYEMDDFVRSFTHAKALEEVEALLKFGAVDVVVVGSLEETLTIAGFQGIADDLEVLDQNSISMIIQQSISSEYAQVNEILAELGEKLTSEALHDLVSRIRLLHQDAEDVAREFVQK